MNPIPSFRLLALLAAPLLLATMPAAAAEPSDFERALKPFLADHCFKCHGEKKQKGDLRLDTLALDFANADTSGHWMDVLDRINSGDMPPEKELRPNGDDSARAVDWIATRLAEADTARRASSERVSFHKLTRDEYANTLRDLLGVTYDAHDTTGISEDPDWLGFERIGSVLTLAPSHIEKYLAAADKALDEALDLDGAQPKTTTIHWDPFEIRPQWRGLKKDFEKRGNVNRVRVDIVPNSNAAAWEGEGRRLEIPATGDYLFRIKLSGVHPPDKLPPRVQFYLSDIDRVLYERDVDAPEDKPVTLEFRTHIQAGPHDIRISNCVPGPGATSQQSVEEVDSAFTGLRARYPFQMKLVDDNGRVLRQLLLVDYVECQGPLHESWPSAAHRRIFGEGNYDAAHIRDILTRFAERAFRRPVQSEEVERYAVVAEAELQAGKAFEPAVKTALLAVLCSADFLYVVEGSPDRVATKLTDYELASRFSYFLWSTMPDDELFRLAHDGKLHEPDVLRAQVHRMLADQRAAAFSDAFPRQWLQLRRVGMFAPDKKLYPTYDDYLQNSMIGEATSFFREVLKKNLSLQEFLDSNWTMLNQRLAEHYGIAGVQGESMQRVALKPEDHRGGLLTQAAVLSLTSDGTRHRPVHRGRWVMESILGKTVPPPPANVPAIKATQGTQPKMSLREKLVAHKEDATCAACHRKIDPLGLAFENYDAIGRWRTAEDVRDGAGANPTVDASGELADGRKFADCTGFKQLLLSDTDKFAAAFTEKLATFAMRRVMGYSDRADLQQIVTANKADNYQLATLVENFVASDLFQKR